MKAKVAFRLHGIVNMMLNTCTNWFNLLYIDLVHCIFNFEVNLTAQTIFVFSPRFVFCYGLCLGGQVKLRKSRRFYHRTDEILSAGGAAFVLLADGRGSCNKISR